MRQNDTLSGSQFDTVKVSLNYTTEIGRNVKYWVEINQFFGMLDMQDFIKMQQSNPNSRIPQIPN